MSAVRNSQILYINRNGSFLLIHRILFNVLDMLMSTYTNGDFHFESNSNKMLFHISESVCRCSRGILGYATYVMMSLESTLVGAEGYKFDIDQTYVARYSPQLEVRSLRLTSMTALILILVKK